MNKRIVYSEFNSPDKTFWMLFGGLAAVVGIALLAWYYMEHNGHWVTGMDNHIVWGMPHVFAIFLIVAASGALNVASIGTVFNKAVYKPLGRLSGLIAIALLAGGLMILVLDLGRPDRLIVAMTTYNFKSIFAWNIILYNGFFAIVIAYLWTQMDRTAGKYYKAAGFFAFLWRLILTMGTGSIFGFLMAREHYDAAIMGPMFVIMSFAFGLAFFILILMAAYHLSDRELGTALLNRLRRLLGVFIGAILLFVAIKHLTNLYATEHHGVEAFILSEGGIYTYMFWVVQIFFGSLVPLFLIYCDKLADSRTAIMAAAALVIIGGLAQIYVLLIGGQAYPMVLFPGMDVASSFNDGVIASYSPTLAETLLGLGGIAVALLLITIATKNLRFMPESLADKVVDPHHKD